MRFITLFVSKRYKRADIKLGMRRLVIFIEKFVFIRLKLLS